MSAPGYVQSLINKLDAETRAVLTTVFDYVMRENALGANTKAENFSWFRVEGTTSSVANTEFSVLHGMAQTPSKLIPIIPLDTVNAVFPKLTVSRAADARRIYLKSDSTSAFFQAYLE